MWHTAACDHWHHLTPTSICGTLQLVIMGNILPRHPYVALCSSWPLAPSYPDIHMWHTAACDLWHHLTPTSICGTLHFVTIDTILPRHPYVAHCSLWPLATFDPDSHMWHTTACSLWHHLTPTSSDGTLQHSIYWYILTVLFPASWLSNNRGTKSFAKLHLFSVSLCWGTVQPSFVFWSNHWQFALLYLPLILYQLYLFPFTCDSRAFVFMCFYIVI
jgi:hypothetical protein